MPTSKEFLKAIGDRPLNDKEVHELRILRITMLKLEFLNREDEQALVYARLPKYKSLNTAIFILG
jgi:hypothetical protein